QTGLTLDVRAAGDAGTLTNKLVLTQGSPTGDVAFGVDNTFASRALEAGVFADADVTLPAGAADFALPGGEQRVIPIDNANVCVNIDTGWFAERGIPEPRTLADLTQKRYRNLMVVPGAATSSPGLAFLLATIAKFGPPDSSADGSWGGAVTGFETYWRQLMANGVKLTSGWSDAYYVDFTQGGKSGKRPIVVSYDSSPAFTIDPKTGKSTTKALLDTCFQQVEYAGVLSGAANPKGAEQLIEFLLSPEVQAALPESMYVFPVRADTPLPAEWAAYAQQPTAPVSLDPGEISAGRDDWLRAWTDITTR
ncbi:MAG: thiamine ABC transporter substrate-binding protein, partial [Nocardioides sp.]